MTMTTRREQLIKAKTAILAYREKHDCPNFGTRIMPQLTAEIQGLGWPETVSLNCAVIQKALADADAGEDTADPSNQVSQ